MARDDDFTTLGGFFRLLFGIFRFLFKLIGISALIGSFFYSKHKSKQAEEELQKQYLLNSSSLSKSPEQIQKELQREDIGFRWGWSLFGGLPPLWSALASAVLDSFILYVSFLALVWFSMTYFLTSPNNQFSWFVGFMATMRNIGIIIIGLISFFWHYPLFKKYKSYYHPEEDSESDYLDNDESEFMLGEEISVPLDERKTHQYVIGMTGTGKSSAAETWFLQDVLAGRGCAIVDPHGDLVENCLKTIANHLYLEDTEVNQRTDLSEAEIEARIKDSPLVKRIKIIDPTDPDYVAGFNPLEKIKGVDSFQQARQLTDAFKKVWQFDEHEAPVMSQVLRNTAYVLIENNRTLLDASRLMYDEYFRKEMLGCITNPEIRNFWKKQYEQWKMERQLHKTDSASNKISEFASDENIQVLVGQKKSTVKFRESMDNGDILLIKLPKGILGSATNLMGAFIIANMHLAAMSRANAPEEDRKPFYVYIDEFQNFASSNFNEMLSEDRKYGLHYILINQYLDKLDDDIVSAIFGNVNIITAFRVGAERDSEMLASRFYQVTGELVERIEKEARIIPGTKIPHIEDRVQYFSLSEEAKLRAEELRRLPERTFAVHYKDLEKPLLCTAFTVERPTGEQKKLIALYADKIKEIVGKQNGRKREEVKEEIRQRAKKSEGKPEHDKPIQ